MPCRKGTDPLPTGRVVPVRGLWLEGACPDSTVHKFSNEAAFMARGWEREHAGIEWPTIRYSDFAPNSCLQVWKTAGQPPAAPARTSDKSCTCANIVDQGVACAWLTSQRPLPRSGIPTFERAIGSSQLHLKLTEPWTQGQATPRARDGAAVGPATLVLKQLGWDQLAPDVSVAVLLGLSLGFLLAQLDAAEPVMIALAFPGKLWLKALTCVVLPLILCGMIQSVALMRELPGAKEVALWLLALYSFTTMVAAVEGASISMSFLSWAVRPLEGLPSPSLTTAAPMTVMEAVLNVFDQLVPKNVVADAANNRLISVIVSSLLLGLLLPSTKADGRKSTTLEVVEEVNDVVNKVIRFLIRLSPVGVCSLVFAGSSRFNLQEMGTSVAALVGCVLTALAVHIFVFCPMLLILGAGRNPVKYFQTCLPALFTALGSCSSAACLPLNLEAAAKNGLRPHVAKLALNLGATINMDGNSIYLICSTVCIALMQGISLNPGDIVVLCLMATVCTMGTAPVPSASLVLLATLLSMLNIPVTEARLNISETFGLVSAMDWLLDRLRTCANVYGDACVAAVVDHRTRLLVDKAATVDLAEIDADELPETARCHHESP
eukprot:Skav206206  [mRNA]  locus=scaffold1844:434713:438785:- [translate_table: standard]